MEVMKANIAYKFELMPTREQTRIFAQAAGCRRFVWNKATELQKQRLEHNLPFLNYAELCEKLTCWGSVRISVSGEVIPGAAQRGCPLYLRCSMPDLMR